MMPAGEAVTVKVMPPKELQSWLAPEEKRASSRPSSQQALRIVSTRVKARQEVTGRKQSFASGS